MREGAPPVRRIQRRSFRGSYPCTRNAPPTRSRTAFAPRESIQMIALRSGRPARSIATVPDHCDVTDTPMIESTGTAPRPTTR